MAQSYLCAAAATMMAASGALLLPSVAHADLISIGASYNGGVTTTLATGNGTSPVVANGTLGSFVMTATATGAPLLPQPDFDTASINVNSSGSGVLEMFITEQGLTSPQGINNFLSTFTFQPVTGNGIVSVVEKTFVSASNLLYTGSALASITNTNGGFLTSGITAATPYLNGMFSETIEYIITASGFGATNDTVNMSQVVPEPASLGLLGAGLGLMMLVAYRRRAF